MASSALTRRKVHLVEVFWDDIASFGPNWHSEDDVEGMAHVCCRSIGYLWHKGRKSLKLVDTITDDGGLGNVNVILNKVVTKIRTLDTVTVEYQRPPKDS